MISGDIIEEFIDKLKKEKMDYFIFLVKEPSKKQKEKNPDIDINIAHYQDLSTKNTLVLCYCLNKMLMTGEFDPNLPWEDEDEEEGPDIISNE